jgi:dTDP-4-dehydrorhamnose reductase
MKWLIFGHNGWIGKQLIKILSDKNEEIITTNCRADNINDVEQIIINTCPERILCIIGRTHGENFKTIDYLEQKGKLIENINDNLFSPMILAFISSKYNIHLTYMGTGCIFSGYDKEYYENDLPDFFGSSYSVVKGYTDRLMKNFTNVLNVRIRMPISDDLNNDRNFIYKITHYEKICSMNNSMTVLPELLPILIDMIINNQNGTINLVNPGCINHNEILEMYKEIIDPNFTWNNMTLEEQDNILLAKRSNNILNTNKLQKLYPNVNNIKDSIKNLFYNIKK